MDKRARIRWSLLCTALTATVAAILNPPEEEGVAEYTDARAKPPRPVAVSASAPRAPDRVEWVASDVDPFAPRGWLPETPPAEPARVVKAVEASEPPPPSPPPPLPYAFIGQMNDAGNQVVYLSRGDQLLLARAGEVLEGTYKVVLIDAAHIEFETMSSGLRQSLTIPSQDRP